MYSRTFPISAASSRILSAETFFTAKRIKKFTNSKRAKPARATRPILQSKKKSMRMISEVSSRPWKTIITARVATSPTLSIVLVVTDVISPRLFSLK